jgi:LPS-assembly protein
VVFHVKKVPALYLPYIVYPVREDQRSTGFLFPSVGYSSTRGVSLGEAFFWAMGRSVDQTFYVDNYSKFGYGFGHEFRYAAASPSRGTFRTYVFQPRVEEAELDYDLDYQALQLLPGKVRATVNVRQYSNLLFQQNVQDSFNLATTRNRRASLNLQRALGKSNLQLLVDSNETFFPNQSRVNRHLPMLRANMAPQRLWGTGATFRYDLRAERLENGTRNEINANRDRFFRYQRFDLNPELARPISVSFLQITPQVEGRYTYYGDSLDADNQPTGQSLTRAYFESGVEMRGPTFARVYNTPGNFYSEKYKHVIGPELVYRYRSPVDDFSNIPRFDAVDTAFGTNQIQYSLVQSLLAKREGPGGQELPYEFLTWRIGQTYYVDPESAQFDPNYSSNNFETGGTEHFSPLQSRLRFMPSARTRLNFDVEYDQRENVLRTLTLSGSVGGERAELLASWSRAEAFRRNNRNVPARSSVRSVGRLELLADRLTLDAQADWDLVAGELVHSAGRLRWDVQCCGFMVELIRYDYNQRSEQQFRFAIELANIGSFGNFNGEERGQLQTMGSGVFK